MSVSSVESEVTCPGGTWPGTWATTQLTQRAGEGIACTAGSGWFYRNYLEKLKINPRPESSVFLSASMSSNNATVRPRRKGESSNHLKKSPSPPSSMRCPRWAGKGCLVDFKVSVPFRDLFNKCTSYKSREIPKLKKASPLSQGFSTEPMTASDALSSGPKLPNTEIRGMYCRTPPAWNFSFKSQKPSASPDEHGSSPCACLAIFYHEHRENPSVCGPCLQGITSGIIL